jgi:hypothetical protein
MSKTARNALRKPKMRMGTVDVDGYVQLRNIVGLTLNSLQEVERDRDLTVDAKKNKKRQLAEQALTQLDDCKSLVKAREQAASILNKWQVKRDAVLVRLKPEDAATALLFREIRDKFGSLSEERERLACCMDLLA